MDTTYYIWKYLSKSATAVLLQNCLLISLEKSGKLLITAAILAVASAAASCGQDSYGPDSYGPDKDYKLAGKESKRPAGTRISPELESASHEANSTLNLSPLYLGSVIKTGSARALQEEASYNQSITLGQALTYALKYGLPLKISKEAFNYQRFQLASSLASALPAFGMTYNLSRNNIFNTDTISIARTFTAGLSYPVFRGGGVLYSIITQRYREQGWKSAYKATISDVFLDVYQKYTNLISSRVLLQIYASSVEADQEQLRINQAQLASGVGTRFAVLQTESQLAADKQALLVQQIAVRQAALALNFSLNFPMSVNLVPIEKTISEAKIFNSSVNLATLLSDALNFNPSLRQYEMFRLTARRAVQLASAPLYPTVSFFTLYQQNNTDVQPPTNAAAVGGIATSAIASAINSTFAGRVTNNALGQQASFSPTGGSTATQGANTAPQAMPAASGGIPIAAVQSGSLVTSGAVAPSIFGGGTGAGTGSNANGSLQAPAGIFPGHFRSFLMGFALNWSLPNGGLSTAGNINAVRVLARQALLQCNQEMEQVQQLIRSDYLSMLAASAAIDKAAYRAASSREALRLARVRLKAGVGTNLEVIQSRRDYVTAVTGQAQAIASSNLSQAQLLHDMGMISVDTMTKGYQPGVFVDPTRRKAGP